MQSEIGMILEGKVTAIKSYGVFVTLSDGNSGLVHISEISPDYVAEIENVVALGQTVKVKVLGTNKGKLSLSIKAVQNNNNSGRVEGRFKKSDRFRKHQQKNRRYNNINDNSKSFEEMMSRFKKASDEKMSDLKRVVENRRGTASRRPNKTNKD